jgi:pimeloyl-ACP methyl ester carboxylesterase
MKSYVDLSFDVDEIGSALNEEGFDDVSVLAWCSGGRTALDFVVKNADRVRSLVLVSPSLCGVKGVSPQLTGFESGLGQVCSTVRKHPAVANFFVKGIDKLVKPADWAKNRNEPVKRAAALFGLPAKDRAGALVASMLDVEFLRNYAKRDQSDSTYPIHEALQRLTLPILLITGDHDNIVNSEYVATVLDVWATDVVHASIRGAGHYAQDLQYSHFLTLANRFLNDQALTSGARVRVKRIGRHARGN